MIVFLIFRLGRSGDIFHWAYHGSCPLSERAENELVLGVTTSTGYLYIVLVLLVGTAMGDTGKYTVCNHSQTLYTLQYDNQTYTKMLLFNLFGFIFYAAVGSTQIAFYRNEERPPTVRIAPECHNKCSSYFQGKHMAFSMGAMSILTSFTFLVDVTWSALDVLRK